MGRHGTAPLRLGSLRPPLGDDSRHRRGRSATLALTDVSADEDLVDPHANAPAAHWPLLNPPAHTAMNALLHTRLLALALLLAAPASAQDYAHDARAEALIPAMLGRGDAGVAIPTRETAFFINPSHVAATTGGFHFSLVGVAVRGTPSVQTVGERLLDEIESDESSSTLTRELAAEMRQPLEARATALLPSFSFRAGRVGASAGAFVHSTARVQSIGAPDGDSLYAFTQTDGIGAFTLSVQLPESQAGAITVGAGARYIRRYASTYDLYSEDIEDLDDPALVEGSTVAVDLGAHWRTPVAGLDAAVAVYDLGGGMEYEPSDFFGLLGSGGDASEAQRIERAFEGRDGRASFRVGAAYRPALSNPVVGVVLAADYVSASTTAYSQSLLGHLRLGAEATLGNRLGVRAGLSGAGPSVGASLNLVVLKLDYALFSQHTGRIEGQDGGFRHALLLRLGLD